jgi:hypothetical protein
LEVLSKEHCGEQIMVRESTVSTSLRIPESKYITLEELKRIEDKSINSLVLEAIDLLIIEKADILEEQMQDRTIVVRDVIKKLKEEK